MGTAGFIIVGVMLLLLCFLISAIAFIAIHNGDYSGVCMFIFVAMLAVLATICFIGAGRTGIKTHEIATPAYLIQETKKDGKIVKDTTYIYSFPL